MAVRRWRSRVLPCDRICGEMRVCYTNKMTQAYYLHCAKVKGHEGPCSSASLPSARLGGQRDAERPPAHRASPADTAPSD
jgi:hypothetical protein